MNDKAWLSSITTDHTIGLKQGLRKKYFSREWEPTQHELPLLSEEVFATMDRHTSWYTLDRDDYPEACAIFDEKCFERVGYIFVAGAFFVVKDELEQFPLTPDRNRRQRSSLRIRLG